MNKLQTRLTSQLAASGAKNASAMAESLLEKRGHMKDGVLTKSGLARQSMGNAGRAEDRAAKASGHPAGDYKYNAKTNSATLRRR